jgi:hypothetical protein
MCAWLQGREGEAGQALRQAQRSGLDSPRLWVELGDYFTQLGRLASAADCLARAAAAKDGVKVSMGPGSMGPCYACDVSTPMSVTGAAVWCVHECGASLLLSGLQAPAASLMVCGLCQQSWVH